MAAIFLLSADYMIGFEVFYYTLTKTGSLEGVPIIVLTDDPSLKDNRMLQSIGARVVLIDRSPQRYWFLKLQLFRDLGVDRAMYFDVDLICLANIDGLMDVDTDLAGSPTFSRQRVKAGDGTTLPLDVTTAAVDKFFEPLSPKARPKRANGLNSGVMVLGRAVMTDAVRSKLLSMSQQGEYHGDQNVIAHWLSQNKRVGFRYLDPAYNVPRRTLDCTSVEYFTRIRDRIKILHFNGGNPWKRGSKTSYVDYIWWDLYAESRPFIERLYR